MKLNCETLEGTGFHGLQAVHNVGTLNLAMSVIRGRTFSACPSAKVVCPRLSCLAVILSLPGTKRPSPMIELLPPGSMLSFRLCEVCSSTSINLFAGLRMASCLK